MLNVDRGYVHTADEFEWIAQAPEAIKWLHDQGYLVIVVTNQSGIGRGLYSESDFLTFTEWIGDQLAALGTGIDATYYCPHHPTDGQGPYRRDCECRKPRPGLLLAACDDWPIDKTRSFAAGDSLRDLEAAHAAGVRAFQFEGGSLLDFVKFILRSLTDSDDH